MIKLGMSSIATSIKGQGVGSAYTELVELIRRFGKEDFTLSINKNLGKCDLIHFQNIDPVSFLRIALTGVPTVMSVHFVPETMKGAIKMPKWFDFLLSRYMMRMYKNADHLHIVNKDVRKDLVRLGVKKERIFYIPNVVSEKGFYPMTPEEKKELRKAWGYREEDFIVMGCGQVQTKKGVHVFAEAARALPDTEFVWAGGFCFGAATDGYPELKKLMDDPPENLRFPGIVDRDKVNELLNIADLFFLPSTHEQFGMVILEAARTETPVLLRDLPVYRKLFQPFYVSDTDTDGFVEKIRMFRSDPEFYREQREKVKGIAERYSEERIYALWKKAYLRFVREGKAGRGRREKKMGSRS